MNQLERFLEEFNERSVDYWAKVERGEVAVYSEGAVNEKVMRVWYEGGIQIEQLSMHGSTAVEHGVEDAVEKALKIVS